MATNGEIANDLEAHAVLLRGRGQDTLLASLRRGATAIRELQSKVMTLEIAAQSEADAFERYRNGDDG